MDDWRMVHLRLGSRGSWRRRRRRRLRCRRRRSLRSRRRRRCRRRTTSVHLYRLSVPRRRRCRRRATPVHLHRMSVSGPRVAQQETVVPRAARPEVQEPRVARPRAPGPCSVQQGSPEAAPVRRENLQGKDKQVTVAEPSGQSETVTPARGQEKVWRRWSRGNPTRQRRRVGRSERGER